VQTLDTSHSLRDYLTTFMKPHNFGSGFTPAFGDDIVPPVLEVGRERVRQAELKYTQASARAAEIQASGNGDLQEALRQEEKARAEYLQALERLRGLLRSNP